MGRWPSLSLFRTCIHASSCYRSTAFLVDIHWLESCKPKPHSYRRLHLIFVGLSRLLFLCFIIGHRGHSLHYDQPNPRLHLVPSRSWTSLPVLCSSLQDSTIILGLYYFPHCCRSAFWTCVLSFDLLLSTFSACFYSHFLSSSSRPPQLGHTITTIAVHTTHLDPLFLSYTRHPFLSRQHWTRILLESSPLQGNLHALAVRLRCPSSWHGLALHSMRFLFCLPFFADRGPIFMKTSLISH